MKKKLVLFIILIVSLFIYSGRVNAIVMWMQCTATADGAMNNNPEQDGDAMFKYYNTFAIINDYNLKGNNSSAILRHVVFNGNNFFGIEGPTFIAQRTRRASTYEGDNICWFQNDYLEDSHGDNLTECDEDNDSYNPQLSPNLLNGGVCPTSVYQTTGSLTDQGTSGGTKGDFVVMAGRKNASEENKELLDGYLLALYKVNYNDKTSFWVMESYDATGAYGFIYDSSIEKTDEFNKWYSFKSFKSDYPLLSSYLEIPGTGKSLLSSYVLDNCGNYSLQNNENNAFNNPFNSAPAKLILEDGEYDGCDYDSGFVDWTQHTQLMRLLFLGRDYFKITSGKPRVLLGNLGNNNDKIISNSIRYADSTKVTVWPELKSPDNDNNSIWSNLTGTNDGWLDVYSGAVAKQSTGMNRFEEEEPLKNLIDTSKKISDAIKKGNSVELEVDELTNFSSNLREAYEIISDSLSFEYRLKNADCSDGDTTSDAIASAVDFTSCRMFNKNFNSLNDFKGSNSARVLNVFASTVSDQIAKASNDNFNIINLRDTAKEYLISISKAASYILNNTDYEDTNGELKNTLADCLKLARNEFQIEIVLDCGSILGDLKDKIGKYIDIIKIVVPIILIGFGILDFTKAIFAGDDAKMKETQKLFLKRVIIAILFFLSPVFIRLLLSIANKAWSFISPGSCGLF